MEKEKAKVLEFSSDEEEEEEEKSLLKIDKAFAKRFEEKNKRDDLYRAKEKGVSLYDSESSDGEEEDEIGEALTAKLDFDIMKTISMIRNKDKRIYDESYRPFEGDAANSSDEESLEKKSKPFTYKDMVREQALRKIEKMDANDSDSDDEQDVPKGIDSKVVETYDEAQEKLRQAFQEAAAQSDDEDDDDMLKVKQKTKAELEKEQDDFQKYLRSLAEKDARLKKTDGEDVNILKNLFSQPAGDKDEEFLRKYVLSEGWLDKNSQEDRPLTEYVSDDEDLEAVEQADQYEAKYNFRFEEPDGDKIASYPRFDESTVRRKENARKRQRESKKERKRLEKQRAEEELRRLKNLKRQELEKRLEATVKVAGLQKEKLAFKPEDLEKDFDPEEWDKKMAAMFNDDYYNEDDEAFDRNEWNEDNVEEDDIEEDKELPDEPVIIQEQDLFQKEREEEEADQKKKQKKKKKKKGILVDEGEDEQGVDELEKLQGEIQDELYKLDYEDVIAGGIKTRFRYRKVNPNDYGLSTEEILVADTRLLQNFVSLKKMAPYRDEEWQAGFKHRRRFRQALREQLGKSKSNTQTDNDKNKSNTHTDNSATNNNKPDGEDQPQTQQQTQKKPREPKEPLQGEKQPPQDVEEGAAGKKRRRRKRKKAELVESSPRKESADDNEQDVQETEETKKKRKMSETEAEEKKPESADVAEGSEQKSDKKKRKRRKRSKKE